MKYKMKMNNTDPLNDPMKINKNNSSEYIEKWYRILLEDINSFKEYLETDNLHDKDLDLGEIPDLILLFLNWIIITNNILGILLEKFQSTLMNQRSLICFRLSSFLLLKVRF